MLFVVEVIGTDEARIVSLRVARADFLITVLVMKEVRRRRILDKAFGATHEPLPLDIVHDGSEHFRLDGAILTAILRSNQGQSHVLAGHSSKRMLQRGILEPVLEVSIIGDLYA
jgi:hypothetical protein